MKLNRNFLQITATALLTSAGFIIYMNFFQKDYMNFFQEEGTGFEPSISERILWPDAQKLMTEYQDKIPKIMMTTYNEGGTDIISGLKGFTFKKSHLMEILTTNHSGTNADSVIFYFGTLGTFNDMEAGVKWPNMRIIAVGTKNNMILSDSPSDKLPSIFDKAEPCPPKCPQ